MKTSRLFGAFIVGICIGVAILAFREFSGQELPAITVYKSPSCGCCAKWVDHLEENGFSVKAVDTPDVSQMKNRFGVPRELFSCHTAVVDGYVIEGHVPAEEVKRMLAEKPDITGLSVPGMPIGSPGMEGSRLDPYDIIAFTRDGERSVYASRNKPGSSKDDGGR